MKWPDENENREMWDSISGEFTAATMNRYEITPGMRHDDVFRALVARTEFLLDKVEKLESGIRISQGERK